MTKYNEELYRGERHWKEGEFDVYRSTHWSAPGCHNELRPKTWTD